MLAAAAAIRPSLTRAALSTIALQVHLAEGWAYKRLAFEGDEQAATRAVDVLRVTIDNMLVETHDDLYLDAVTWLAESYSNRGGLTDLVQAVEAYGVTAALKEERTSPASVAYVYLQMGILNTAVGESSDTATQADQLALAVGDLDRAESLYQTAGDLAGRAEAAVAKADAVRLLGGAGSERDAADLFTHVSAILQEGDAMGALGQDRFDAILRHVIAAMGEIDALQFGTSKPEEEIGKLRALGTFLRPLTSTRQILLQPPHGRSSQPTSLEAALSTVLSPEVAISYVGGAPHPHGGSLGWAAAHIDWRGPLQALLSATDMVIMVPGSTPGMGWELGYLITERLMAKTLLIMVPANVDFPAAENWETARVQALDSGLQLPAYDISGAMLRFDTDGRLGRRLEFELIWDRQRLLPELEDLMREPEEMARRITEARESVDEYAAAGKVRISRPPA